MKITRPTFRGLALCTGLTAALGSLTMTSAPAVLPGPPDSLKSVVFSVRLRDFGVGASCPAGINLE